VSAAYNFYNSSTPSSETFVYSGGKARDMVTNNIKVVVPKNATYIGVQIFNNNPILYNCSHINEKISEIE